MADAGLKTITRTVELRDGGQFEVRSTHLVGSDIQARIAVYAGPVVISAYLTTAQARELAGRLVEISDHYDAEHAAAVAGGVVLGAAA